MVNISRNLIITCNMVSSCLPYFSVTAAVVCEMPADYPTSVPPILTIEVIKGLSLDRGDELLLVAQKIANENIGLPSIFTVAEGVKEWLQDNNIPGQDGSMYSGISLSTHSLFSFILIYQ